MDTEIKYEGVTVIANNADAMFNELDRKWQKTEFYDHCGEDMEALFGGDGMNVTANIIYHIDGVNDTDECGNDIHATVPDYDDAERVREKIAAMDTFYKVYGNCTLILEIGDDDSFNVCLHDEDDDYLGCITFLANDEDEDEEDEDDEAEFVMVQSENDFDDLLDISATKSKTQPREKGKSSAESIAEQAMAWLAEQTGFNTRDDR